MDMRCSNPCIKFSNVCTKSCKKRTCLLFCLFLSFQNHVVLDLSWHYYWYFVVLTYKFASKTHGMPSLCKTIFDHFMLCLHMSFKVVILYCWNKGQKWWNIFYKMYVHFSFCSNSFIHDLGKQNTESLIFYNNVYFFLNLGFA